MLSACKKGGTQLENKSITESDKSIKSVEAVIPNPVSEGTDVNKFINGDDHWKWWEDYIEKVHNSLTVQEGNSTMNRYRRNFYQMPQIIMRYVRH